MLLLAVSEGKTGTREKNHRVSRESVRTHTNLHIFILQLQKQSLHAYVVLVTIVRRLRALKEVNLSEREEDSSFSPFETKAVPRTVTLVAPEGDGEGKAQSVGAARLKRTGIVGGI